MLAQFKRPTPRLRLRDALGFAWRTLIRWLPLFVGIMIAVDLIYHGLELARLWLEARVPHGGVVIPVIQWGLGTVLSMAYIRVTLKLFDGERPALSDLHQTPTSLFRFAVTSIAFTLASLGAFFLAYIAVAAVLASYLNIASLHRHFPLPWSVGISALGAATLFGSFRVGRWVLDREFYGHVVVDRGVGPAAAFRASAALARTIRWQLLAVLLLFIGIELVFGGIGIVVMDNPPIDPRLPWRPPHITAGWPPMVNTALTEVLGGLAVLDIWLLLLTLSFAYRWVGHSDHLPSR